MSSSSPVRSIHVVDADVATFDLIREWLEPEGWRVLEHKHEHAQQHEYAQEHEHDHARGNFDAADPPSLVLVDLAFPRHAALPALERLRNALPGVPVLVMSSTIFDSVCCSGPCAQRLGVAGVLPKPLSREAIVAAVTNVARRGRDGG
jgi:CheY-like chemotaxis protein